jgi:hypothetical protein
MLRLSMNKRWNNFINFAYKIQRVFIGQRGIYCTWDNENLGNKVWSA